MAWRMLLRRCPTRSFTVVGDLAQAGAGGVSSWAQAFDVHAPGRWRVAELTVGYRTPKELMDVAAGLLPRIAPGATAPRAVRSTDDLPWARRVAAEDLAAELARAVRAEQEHPDGGTLGVVVPAGRRAALAAACGVDPEAEIDLDADVVVVNVRRVKGLEFDVVIVVEPSEIVAESPRGESDLYVALTRATRRLGVLHTRDLPPGVILASPYGVRRP